ncbi:MAG: helicase-related protein, partial [Clostridium sp.]
MSSTKCTLKKEVKNEINKYIDSEFITEMIKEIVSYINTTNKVRIIDSSFDENDENSRVNLISDGAFNIDDYMYVKDFLYELSWEGSYIKAFKESESSDGVKGKSKYIPMKISEESDFTYKYIPKDIASILYEKVENSMQLRKGELYKEFKNRYTSEYLFSRARWYKRSRDGKVYCDIDLNELDEDRKIKYEEQIKAEIGNAYKTRWGNLVASKVVSLNNELLLDTYNEGCKILGIKSEYLAETIECDKSYN